MDASSNHHSETRQDLLQLEQVKLLYAGLGNAIVINAILAALLVTVQYPLVSAARAWGWLLLIGGVLAARTSLAVAWHLRKGATAASARLWLLRFRIAVAGTGAAWGMGSVLLFPAGHMAHQAFLALTLAGMSVGSITLLAVDRVSMLGFLLPALAPVAVLFGLEGGEMAYAMGGMALVFLLFIPFTASRAGAALQENFRLRIRAEQQESYLRESEARLNRAQHSARVGNWELDLSNNELHWSDEIYRMFEIDRARFGASYEAFLNAIHPDDRARVNRAYTESLATRQPYDIVHRLQMPDGRVKYVHERCESVFDDAGRPLRSLGTVQDITEQQSAENTLRENEAHFRFMLENSPIAARITDADTGQVVFANQRYAMLINSTPEHVLGVNPKQFYANPQEYQDALARLGRGEHVANQLTELLIPAEPAEKKWTLVSYLQLTYRNRPAVLGWFYDVTELTRATAEVRRQKEYLQAIFETEPECVKVLAPDGALVNMNPAGLTMLEVDTLEEAKEKGLLAFVDPAYREAFGNLGASVLKGSSGVLEFPITGKKGTKRWLETHAAPLRDENGTIVGVLAVTRDITEHKASEQSIRQMAFYDRLTNLPNRRLLEDRLVQEIARAQRARLGMSLLFVDLDTFKEVNDDMGHEAGDWLLKQVAERMQQCLRASDTAARIGGDEFVVLLPDAHAVKDATRVAEKIRTILAQPFAWREGSTIQISGSIGVAMYPEHADNPRDLLRFGDEAMYSAKKSGRNAVHVFSAPAPAAEEGPSIVRLIWKPAYACGEPEIDREHEELFRLANALLDIAVERAEKPDAFNGAFDALLWHVTGHFAHEEEILRAHHYEQLAEHTRLHRQLVEQATDLRRQSEEPGFPIGRLVAFLVSEVVADHMLKEDKKFAPLFGAPA